MKKIISVIVLIGLVMTVWLGASFYSSRTTGEYMTALPALYKQNDYMHIKTIEHKQSTFSSSGQFEVRFPSLMPVTAGSPNAPGLIVQYNISNLLLPDSAGRLEWSVTGNDSIDQTLKQLFGQGPTATGAGKIGYDGGRQSSIDLSELFYKDTDTTIKMTPVKGAVSWDNQTLRLTLGSDHFNARAEGFVTDWRGVSADIALNNRQLGLGTYAFAIQKGASESSTFEEMKLTKKVSLENDRFNFAVSQTMKKYSYDKFKLSDVDQEFSLRGFDKESVLSISTILQEVKDVSSLTKEEQAVLSKSLRELFNKGFSIGAPKLSANIEGGSISGELNMTVEKNETTEAVFSSAKRLRATGQVNLNGKSLLDNMQQTTALMLGLAVKTPEGLMSRIELMNGVLTANGKTFDVKDNLMFLDDMINAALNP